MLLKVNFWSSTIEIGVDNSSDVYLFSIKSYCSSRSFRQNWKLAYIPTLFTVCPAIFDVISP